MLKKLLNRVNAALDFIVLRQEELLNVSVGLGQVGLNFWLAVTLKTDPKAQRNGNVTSNSSNSQNAIHQQIGLVTTPMKQTPLTTAHSLTMYTQQGNYNFGQMYPDLIRALLTLYLATSLLHTIHSRLKTFMLDRPRQRKFGTFMTIMMIIGLAVLDIAIVNDLIVLSSNDYNMQALAVNDVYTSSTGKGRSKEFQQYLDYLISSIILGYRWLQMLFLVSSLWSRDLRPFIRGRKGVSAPIKNTPEATNEPQVIQQQPMSPPTVKLLEQPKPDKTIVKRKGGRPTQPKVKKSQTSTNAAINGTGTPPQKLLRNTSISSQSSFQPLSFSKNQSQIDQVQPNNLQSTEAENNSKHETTFSGVVCERILIPKKTRRCMRQVRSESYAPNSSRNSVQDLPRSLSEITKKEAPRRDFHSNVHGHLFVFSIDTPKGSFSFETSSISEFNKRIDEIASLNNWHDFVLLNVKLHFWKDAYERIKQSPARNVLKGELVKLISQYSLSMINQQQNFGHVEFE